MCRTAFAKGWLLLVSLLIFAIPNACWSQGLDDLDDLEDLDQDVVTEKPFEPGITVDKWEVQLQIGFMSLTNTLFGADQIIVKWDAAGKLFADMTIDGSSSFSPQIRFGRNWGHIGWQSTLGMAMGNFTQRVSNVTERSVSGRPGEVVLDETDPETGSLVMWYQDQALVYNILTKGRVIPYVLGGIGAQYWVIDSTYIFNSQAAFTYSFGGGIRIVGDELFSVVFEIRDYVATVQHRSDAVFLDSQIDPGDDTRLVNIPMTALNPETGREEPFGGFEKVKNNNIWFSIGLVATF